MEREDTNQVQTVPSPACKRIKLASSGQDQAKQLECVGESKPSYQGSEPEPVSFKDTTKSEEGDRTVSSEEGYYLLNFKSVLNIVLTSSPERHVIADDAKSIVEGFMGLSQREQHLYVRLFLRKHQWLRSTKISYEDIAGDLRPVLSGLVKHGFLIDESSLTDPSEVLSLLQLSELKELRKELNLLTSASGKSQIIESLFKHDRQHQPLFGSSQFLVTVVRKAKKKLGVCVKLAVHPLEVFSKITLLFSLTNSMVNGREEENEFSQIIFRMLQVNIGTLTYPEYEVNVSQPLFATVDSFQRYYYALKEEQVLVQAIEAKDDTTINRTLERARTELEKEVLSLQTLHSKSDPKPSATNSQGTVNLSMNKLATIHKQEPTLPSFLLPFTAGWLYARLLSKVAEYLEKKGKYELANEVLELLLSQTQFCGGFRGRWWERLALNCDYHLKKKEKCLDEIKRALADPHVRPPRRLSLIKRARKLCESLSVNAKKQRKNESSAKRRKPSDAGKRISKDTLRFELSDFPEMEIIPAQEVCVSGVLMRANDKHVYLTKSSSSSHLSQSSSNSSSAQSCTAMVGVEGYAMFHYNNTEGWPCMLHAEGSIFTTVFGLLMWNAIFTDGIPDVFRTPYQGGPLDLFSDSFYKNRKDMIEERLKWIKDASSEDLSQEIENCWDKNVGTACVAIKWELFNNIEDAKSLAVCMGGELLSHICEVFSKDFNHSGGGLPDLTLWNPNSTSCKFVEVKGPGDRLSHKQIVWLSRLAEWGCTVEVCRVKASLNKMVK